MLLDNKEWWTAHLSKKRVFYETSTRTIRLCPENYLIAYWDTRTHKKTGWKAEPDKAVETMGITKERIQSILNEYQNGSTGGGIAEALHKANLFPKVQQ